jgi:hypothetical protein
VSTGGKKRAQQQPEDEKQQKPRRRSCGALKLKNCKGLRQGVYETGPGDI